MKKMVIKNFFHNIIINKKFRNIFMIDILFFLHTSLGIYLIYLASLELDFSYKTASYIWISFFIPIFIIKTRKDIKDYNNGNA